MTDTNKADVPGSMVFFAPKGVVNGPDENTGKGYYAIMMSMNVQGVPYIGSDAIGPFDTYEDAAKAATTLFEDAIKAVDFPLDSDEDYGPVTIE